MESCLSSPLPSEDSDSRVLRPSLPRLLRTLPSVAVILAKLSPCNASVFNCLPNNSAVSTESHLKPGKRAKMKDKPPRFIMLVHWRTRCSFTFLWIIPYYKWYKISREIVNYHIISTAENRRSYIKLFFIPFLRRIYLQVMRILFSNCERMINVPWIQQFSLI